jgi:tRNA-dihydrouridine synthase A
LQSDIKITSFIAVNVRKRKLFLLHGYRYLNPNHHFSVAPMMDWTDRHCRYFHRLLTSRALLYTEMLTADAVIHGDRAYLLGFSEPEHPLALQLGGSDPAKMAAAARIAEDWGYDEININVGCPSDRVQRGRFGACLMLEPGTVAACFDAMQDAVAVPVTVKCRIGVDDQEGYDYLRQFVDPVAAAGCRTFIVHARKAYLQGLSPKENRDIPPLRYDYVHRLKAERPDLTVVLNGGLKDVAGTKADISDLDGAMFGREAYQNPYCLAAVDRVFFGATTEPLSRHDAVRAMVPYIEAQLAKGLRLQTVTRHMIGLFQGLPGARAWRRYLSENAYRSDADTSTLMAAAALVPEPLHSDEIAS